MIYGIARFRQCAPASPALAGLYLFAICITIPGTPPSTVFASILDMIRFIPACVGNTLIYRLADKFQAVHRAVNCLLTDNPFSVS